MSAPANPLEGENAPDLSARSLPQVDVSRWVMQGENIIL